MDGSRQTPRHCYAQRHADAGVPVDVLKELMDHRLVHTTMGYYRVGEERRREAVDRVTALRFDRHGNRVWRTAQSLLDSEHVRRAIGEVAVPYGVREDPGLVERHRLSHAGIVGADTTGTSRSGRDFTQARW
ncbi:hypothetical protein ABT040_24155 [Streptomyces sp. NPDC002688]|uniref:hypothetical protein n=1 Tax=Streptomyces sp. NPDC002688 TaxID=3154423 RepID=UPI00332749AE